MKFYIHRTTISIGGFKLLVDTHLKKKNHILGGRAVLARLCAYGATHKDRCKDPSTEFMHL